MPCRGVGAWLCTASSALVSHIMTLWASLRVCGGSDAAQKVCVPQSGPFGTFLLFPPRNVVLMWRVGRPGLVRAPVPMGR